jgi:outer membrane protein assembly factor BamB
MKRTTLRSRFGVLTFAALGALTCGALACEGLKGGAAQEPPTWKHRAAWVLDVDFERSIVAQSRRKGEPYERGQPEIDVKGRRVFVGSSDHGLYAVSAVNGETIWRFETLGFVNCAPLYDPEEDVVYFGSNDGALYKVEAASGKLLWRLATNAEVARRPVLSGAVLYAANANDTVLAIEPKTGKIIWSQHRTPAMGMEVAGYSGPAVAFGRVYMGFSDGTATAFDAVSGDERWQPVDLAGEAEQVLGEIPKYLDVDTTPVPTNINAGSVVVFGSYAGGVYALEAESGVMVWSNTGVLGVSDFDLWEQPATERNGEPQPSRRLLLVATGTTGLWALDPETGREVWRRDLPVGGVSRPVPVSGALLLNASQLGTYLLSPIDGSLIDGIHFADGASSVPAVYGHRAFVLSNNGSLYGISVGSPDAPELAARQD